MICRACNARIPLNVRHDCPHENAAPKGRGPFAVVNDWFGPSVNPPAKERKIPTKIEPPHPWPARPRPAEEEETVTEEEARSLDAAEAEEGPRYSLEEARAILLAPDAPCLHVNTRGGRCPDCGELEPFFLELAPTVAPGRPVVASEDEPRLVIVESPFAAETPEGEALNRRYLSAAMADAFGHGEAPFASHGLYTLEGVLDDKIPEERRMGIDAGLAWGKAASKSVAYIDLGISSGMREGIRRALAAGRPVEYRRLRPETFARVKAEAPEGRKDDAEKPRWDLLPIRAASAIVDVLTFGARKYAPENWRKVNNPAGRYYAAALRHLSAWRKGEKPDPETGLPHLAHAACCLLFLLELEEEEAFANK